MEVKYNFTKEYTDIVKGCAILLMLWHHLFAYQSILLYKPLILGGVEVEKLLGLFANICVPLFLFLSGYGLEQMSQRKQLSYKLLCRKIFFLYRIYWVILIVFFLPYVCFNNEFSLKAFLLDVIGLTYTFDPHSWFLSLYVECVLLFPFLLKLNKNFKFSIGILFLLFIIKLIGKFLIDPICIDNSFILLKHLSHLCTYLIVFWVGLQFSKFKIFNFIMGLFVKYRLKGKLTGTILLILILSLLVLARLFLPQYGLFYFIFSPVLVFCLSELFINNSRLLMFLSLHSTNMWLVHYLLIKINGMMIYQLKYPILIFITLVVLSVICSYIINFVFNIISGIYVKFIAKMFI